MNWFSLFVAVCLAGVSASRLDDKCEVFELQTGDVFDDFIHLSSLRNEQNHGEIFRYKFFYNYTEDNYSLRMFFSKSSNVKGLDEQNNYWVLGEFHLYLLFCYSNFIYVPLSAELSDTPDTNVGYSVLRDQSNKFIDKTEKKLKLNDERFVAFEIALTDGKFLKVLQICTEFFFHREKAFNGTTR